MQNAICRIDSTHSSANSYLLFDKYLLFINKIFNLMNIYYLFIKYLINICYLLIFINEILNKYLLFI